MSGTENTESQVIEPLAKFHVKVYGNGNRFVLPEPTRIRYRIREGYFIEVIIRTIEIESGTILERAYFIPKVSTNGVITIPKGLVKELNIQRGDVLEVVLLNYFSLRRLARGASKLKMPVKGYVILEPNEEQQLLK